jgi:hypothetical protein
MTNPWTQLVALGPEKIEDLFERVYSQYNQPFKPVTVNADTGVVELELKDGKRVREKL